MGTGSEEDSKQRAFIIGKLDVIITQFGLIPSCSHRGEVTMLLGPSNLAKIYVEIKSQVRRKHRPILAHGLRRQSSGILSFESKLGLQLAQLEWRLLNARIDEPSIDASPVISSLSWKDKSSHERTSSGVARANGHKPGTGPAPLFRPATIIPYQSKSGF